jgi:glycosyltransferase involved in cell wall biosynthesis
MHIVMFSINPLFPDVVMGGAPKHLGNIALHLGRLGHDVTVLCTRADENARPFRWHERVEVLPLLRFKQPFPQPYAVPAYDLATALQDVGDYLASADRFYMHDGELLFPYAYQHIPTVISLRDNVYPETLLGGFLFQADRLILISEYSRQYVLHTMGRFFPELEARIEVIHNGLDWAKFKPTQPDDILNLLPADLAERPVLLHPHRPEESKGIRQTIAVVDRLVHQHGLHDLIALAPRWHDIQATGELREFYQNIEREIAEKKLLDNFFFHDWIPQDMMPQYFSLGDVTLSLGHFPESFGNAVYESMGCGTPSIVARISTHRELLPDNLIHKVDYGDVDRAAAIATQIITEKVQPSTEALDYLEAHYSIERQLDRYADVILNAKISTPPAYAHQSFDAETRFRLAPWCYHSSERGVYHDFYANYRPMDEILSLLRRYPDGFTLMQANANAVTEADVMAYYRDGYLVPLR